MAVLDPLDSEFGCGQANRIAELRPITRYS